MRGNTVMKGYSGNPTATAATLKKPDAGGVIADETVASCREIRMILLRDRAKSM